MVFDEFQLRFYKRYEFYINRAYSYSKVLFRLDANIKFSNHL